MHWLVFLMLHLSSRWQRWLLEIRWLSIIVPSIVPTTHSLITREGITTKAATSKATLISSLAVASQSFRQVYDPTVAPCLH